MKMRKVGAAAVIGILVAACTPTSSVPAAESLQGAEDANAALPWAFVLNSPPNEDAAAADPDEIVSVPGSELSLRRADINIENGPPDWHPDEHPSMPEVVARGRNPGVFACAL